MTDGRAANASTAPRSPDFTLTKWYMDVVDEHLNAYIGYWVELKWRQVRLQGDHHLLRRAEDGVTTHGGLSTVPPPTRETEARVRWRPRHGSGLWSAAAEPITATLFESDRGAIRWECLMPKARARMDLPQLSIEGWGYVERVELTVPAWNLPFERLLWGRAHTPGHSLVWIRSTGIAAHSLAWYDGSPVADLVVVEDRIQTSACRLDIEQAVPLRQGFLRNTIFHPLPVVTKLLPGSTFRAHERKWVARGTLHGPATPEPATVLLLTAGLCGLVIRRRRAAA
jgi:hypothetical protein